MAPLRATPRSVNNASELLYTLGQCMIRHTKRQRLGGEEVLALPPLHQEDVAGGWAGGRERGRFCSRTHLWGAGVEVGNADVEHV